VIFMSTRLMELAKLCNQLEKTTKRKILINLLIDFFKKLSYEDLKITVSLLSGEYRHLLESPLEVSWGIFFRAIQNVVSFSREEFIELFDKSGDIGIVIYELFKRHKVARQMTLLSFTADVTIKELFDLIRMLARYEGTKSQRKREELIASFFSRLSPDEAKCATKILLGELRVGVSIGLLEEAIASFYAVPVEKIKHAHMVLGLLSEVIDVIEKYGPEYLDKVKPKYFRPLRVMLADTAKTTHEIVERHGGLVATEYKLDGIRVQIHKRGNIVKVFTRRLKEITENVPEIVDFALKISLDFIAEGELIGISPSGQPLPFQDLMKRFKRTPETMREAMKIPIKLYLFDLISLGEDTLLDKPYLIRHIKLLETFPKDVIIPHILTNDPSTIDDFFKESIEGGHEGLVVKRLDSIYTPGIRGKNWLKYKYTHETLDVVIVAAEYGYGRRHKWLSDYYLAVRDPQSNELLVIGKTFKGLTDEEFEEITKKLESIAIKKIGRKVIVKPEIVLEVEFNEIQKSPKYKSGFALRFARVKRIRYDKDVSEIDTIDKVRKLYELQFRYKGILSNI